MALHVTRASLPVFFAIAACGPQRGPAEIVVTLPSPEMLDASSSPESVAEEGASFGEAWSRALPDEVSTAGDLTPEQLAAPMQNTGFVKACRAPASSQIVVKVVVYQGVAIGVTVITSPEDPTLRDCIDWAVRRLAWPASTKREAVATTYTQT
jgi:hypothetical protein